MATTRKRSTSTRSKGRQDAIAMLKADHRKVKELFKAFAKLKSREGADEDKASLVQQACNELTIHTRLEEEIFYPAVRAEIDDGDLMDEALVEHAGAKELVAQLERADPGEKLYDAKVTVLAEQISHHVEEEEGEMFPEARRAKVDVVALGERMRARKQEILKELGLGDQAEDDESAEDSPGPLSHRRATRLERAERSRRANGRA